MYKSLHRVEPHILTKSLKVSKAQWGIQREREAAGTEGPNTPYPYVFTITHPIL